MENIKNIKVSNLLDNHESWLSKPIEDFTVKDLWRVWEENLLPEYADKDGNVKYSGFIVTIVLDLILRRAVDYVSK